MLQQTTVSTVQNKLQTILKEFPNFKSFKSKKIDTIVKKKFKIKNYNLFLSISDEKDYSIAFTIIQTK